MIRAVIDANIVVSAFIKPSSSAGQVLSNFRHGQFTLLYSYALLEEWVDVLARPKMMKRYGVTREQVELLLEVIYAQAQAVWPVRRVAVCRDPADDKVLEAALAGDANFIVSGDDDLLLMKTFERIKIVNISTFLSLV